jgi:hypothetical protein
MEIKNVKRASLKEYSSPTGVFVAGQRCWNVDDKAEIALPCATQVRHQRNITATNMPRIWVPAQLENVHAGVAPCSLSSLLLCSRCPCSALLLRMHARLLIALLAVLAAHHPALHLLPAFSLQRHIEYGDALKLLQLRLPAVTLLAVLLNTQNLTVSFCCILPDRWQNEIDYEDAVNKGVGIVLLVALLKTCIFVSICCLLLAAERDRV